MENEVAVQPKLMGKMESSLNAIQHDQLAGGDSGYTVSSLGHSKIWDWDWF